MLNSLSSVANIFNNMDIFIYPLIVGILLCFSAGILGVILVLKRYSMIGDGLSHVTFGVFAIALSFEFVKTSYAIVIPVVIVAAYVLLRIGESTKIKGDAAIGLISSASLAIGYLVGSKNGFTTDIDSYMFGSIAFASREDLYYLIPVASLILITFIWLYNKIFVVVFDEEFAKATGIKTRRFNMFFAILTAITVVVGIRIMGSLLISAIIILPALSAMQVFTKFKKVIIATPIISIIAFLIAFFCFMNFSSAASIVVVNLGIFFLFVVIGFFKKLIMRFLKENVLNIVKL